MQRFSSLFQPMHSGIALSLSWQAGLLAISLAAYPFDRRLIMGVNPWLKPLKFEISVAIFLLTIGLLLAHLEQMYAATNPGTAWRQAASLTGWTIGIAMIFENTLIALQSARGLRSHMNYTTVFDTGIFGIMAVFILLNTLALAALLVLYLGPESHLGWPSAVITGARLGLAILIWGSIEGVAMVIRKQHLVGTPDNGEGVPFLNWSTTHGDLRIAHFFGVHAIQILMLLGYLVSRTRIPRILQTTAVTTVALAYMAGCYWLYRTALQGRSPLPYIVHRRSDSAATE